MLANWLSAIVLVFILLPVAAGLVIGMGARLFPQAWRGIVGFIGFVALVFWAGHRG